MLLSMKFCPQNHIFLLRIPKFLKKKIVTLRSEMLEKPFLL